MHCVCMCKITELGSCLLAPRGTQNNHITLQIVSQMVMTGLTTFEMHADIDVVGHNVWQTTIIAEMPDEA